MYDIKNITIASTVVIGISEHAIKFGLPIKFIPILNFVTSIVVSFFFVDEINIKNMVVSILFLTLTASGTNLGMKGLGKKLNRPKDEN